MFMLFFEESVYSLWLDCCAPPLLKLSEEEFFFDDFSEENARHPAAKESNCVAKQTKRSPIENWIIKYGFRINREVGLCEVISVRPFLTLKLRVNIKKHMPVKTWKISRCSVNVNEKVNKIMIQYKNIF